MHEVEQIIQNNRGEATGLCDECEQYRAIRWVGMRRICKYCTEIMIDGHDCTASPEDGCRCSEYREAWDIGVQNQSEEVYEQD